MPVRLTPLGWMAGLSLAMTGRPARLMAGRHPASYIISCYGGLSVGVSSKTRKIATMFLTGNMGAAYLAELSADRNECTIHRQFHSAASGHG